MRWFAIILLWLLPMTATAQQAEEASDEDKGMLTRFLEDSLSGAGREVEVIGLRGAISSNATIEELRISDADGPWLSLKGLSLNWNRLAVLRGNVNVNELSAEEISLARIPKTDPSPTTAEAKPFALPELPVSINIKALKADRISLGEPILGEAVDFALDARLILEGGNGDVLLSATRLGGPAGRFFVDGAYSNDTELLRLDLQAAEDAGGLVATLAQLPGAPPLGLTVLGEGPLSDFIADLRLTSDGEERLAGQVELSTEPAPAPDVALEEGGDSAETKPTQVIRADIAGNMAPLFAPDYKDFFGESIALNTLLRRFGDGRTTLENLSLVSRTLNLDGQLALTAKNLPESFDLDITLRDDTGAPVLLPVSGPKNYVQSAQLKAQFDATEGQIWTLKGDVTGIETESAKLQSVMLDGSGDIVANPKQRVTAEIALTMAGLALPDPALTEALGDSASMAANVDWTEGEGVRLSDLTVDAAQASLKGDAHLTGQGQDMNIATNADLSVPDLANLAGLVGRDLGGAIMAQLSGDIAPLSAGFDLDLTAGAMDLAIGEPQVDALLTGESSLAFSARRDETGLTLRQGDLKTSQLTASGNGTLASENSDLHFEAALAEVGPVAQTEGLSGPATVEGNAKQTGADWAFDLSATAPAQSRAVIRAALPQSGGISADYDLEIGRVETFVPSLPGAASIKGTAAQSDAGWAVDFDAAAPFNTKGRGQGVIDPTGTGTNFAVAGDFPLAAANPALQPNAIQGLAQYDLRIQGALEPASVTGTVSMSGARFAMPDLRIALEDISGTIGLANNAAQINLNTQFSGGGDIAVAGSLGLAPPFNANLPVTLRGLQYQQGQLFETTADGTITLSGPATGGGRIAGDISLSQTNIRISPVGLSGGGAVPEITHLAEPGAVHITRDRAGLIAREEASSGPSAPPFGLDVAINIADRIAVRGLGLNADFNGGMRITGTTNDIRPNGELDLIRGRLDFLSNPFELDEGNIALLGDFVPTMRVQATAEQPDATIFIIIDGRMDDPEIKLESDPELPDDEVLSQLLFGRDLSSISPLQAAQLAAALATLSGQGARGPQLGKNAGLDDFGLTFDEDGAPGVRAGKYLDENIYTEVGVDSEGKSTISLNLDVTDNLTVKGKVGSDDESGIGIFFQRDY
ncbi:translocation/assembly module TamB domain-containing protein [Shimia sp. R9_1]|uniref:translocation/assembly module TamB domain-containing protein n=1 Tax=Shimia sp. R9_1 TaxID=2821111 RepID=UPI001ADA0A46|nr:translocation/assembly module TamB domain-containing protein [Shimia sp. R9_1]MBO9407121.1 translocation/assembly module TamB domain-containing protein [Shimia sp. R9_1]